MKKEMIGFLLFVILTSSFYVMIPDVVRIDIQETKSEFRVYENDEWILSGTEWVNIFDGVAKMRAKERSLTESVNGVEITITRFALYKDNISVHEIYIFNGNTTDVTLFPISHSIQVLNGQGKILQYEVKDLLYSGETVKDIESPQNYGHKMKVEWDAGNYYSRIYKYFYKDEGKLTVKYKLTSSDETYNVRLFDPLVITIHNPTNSSYNSATHDLNWSINSDVASANYSLNGGANISLIDLVYLNNWSISLGTYHGGITTDGTYIWVNEFNAYLIYKYYINGTYISSWSTSGYGSLNWDITTDGSNMWSIDETDVVYNYYINGTYINNWSTVGHGSDNIGIATDGINIWIVDYYTTDIYKYYINGTYISSWSTSTQSEDNVDITTDGINIWTVASVNNADIDIIYEYDMNGNYINNWSIIGHGTNNRQITTDGINIWSFDLDTDIISKFILQFDNTTITGIEGQNYVTIYVNDTSANLNSTTQYFTIDTIVPQIIVYSPTNTTYNTSSISLNVAANETINTWWYSLNSGSNTTFTPNTTITGVEGQNNIIIWANDSAGNKNSSIVYFTVDTIYPLITLNNINYINTTNVSILINWSVSDTNLGTVILSFNGVNVTIENPSTNLTYNVTNLNKSIYTYYVWVNDSANNANQTTTQTITVINESNLVEFADGTDVLQFYITNVNGTYKSLSQTDSVPAINITNNGNVAQIINISVNSSIDSCANFYVSTDNELDTERDLVVSNSNTTLDYGNVTNLNSVATTYTTQFNGLFRYAENFTLDKDMNITRMGTAIYNTVADSASSTVWYRIYESNNSVPADVCSAQGYITVDQLPLNPSIPTIVYADLWSDCVGNLIDEYTLEANTEYFYVIIVPTNSNYSLSYTSNAYSLGNYFSWFSVTDTWTVDVNKDLYFDMDKEVEINYNESISLWSWVVLDSCSYDTTFEYAFYVDSYINPSYVS